jgi:hypothetical protein
MLKELAAAGLTVRQIYDPPPLPAECDVNIWKHVPRHSKVASPFADQDRGSHVLLAACGRDEPAVEVTKAGVPPQGLFTRALLKILNNTKISHLSYTSLMHFIKLQRS